MYNIIQSNNCLPVYANITEHSSKARYSKFLSWLSLFGSRTTHDNEETTTLFKNNAPEISGNSTFNVNFLPDVDIPFLIEVGQMIKDIGVSPSGLTCPSIPPFDVVGFPNWYGRKKRVSGSRLPICFFSSPAPNWKQREQHTNSTRAEDRYETTCEDEYTSSHVALITYDWISESIIDAATLVRNAIVENNPNIDLNDCLFELEGVKISPSRNLRPIVGGELTAPERSIGQAPLVQPPPPILPINIPAIPDSPGHSILPGAPATPESGETADTIRADHRHQTPGPQSSNKHDPKPADSNQPASVPAPTEILVQLGTEQAKIAKASDEKRVIVFGSSTITAVEPEVTIADHKVRLSGDAVVVDGTSTYWFPSSSPEIRNGYDLRHVSNSSTAVSTSGSTSQTSEPLRDQLSRSSSVLGAIGPTLGPKKSSLGSRNWNNLRLSSTWRICGIIEAVTLLSLANV
jgi:hypothetical protein